MMVLVLGACAATRTPPDDPAPAPPAARPTFAPPASNAPPAAPAPPTPAEAPPGPPAPPVPTPSVGPVAPDAMLVAGRPVPTGTRIVKFNEPRGYNAYTAPAFFGPRVDRFNNGRPDLPPADALHLAQRGYTFDGLAPLIDQFVIHYDATGLASRTFDVLQHDRGLSCHFLLDLDGTIYQTLDLQERAWHARESNSRSVGIEIANVGAYAAGAPNDFARWYRTAPGGAPGGGGAGGAVGGRTTLILPEASGVMRLDRPLGPARGEPVLGRIHGLLLVQYDLTDPQYDALIKLTAALCRTFPNLEPRYPTDARGRPRTDLLSPAERSAFRGIVGHYHLTTDKIDPGPAFDWARLLAGVKAELSGPAP